MSKLTIEERVSVYRLITEVDKLIRLTVDPRKIDILDSLTLQLLSFLESYHGEPTDLSGNGDGTGMAVRKEV